jgi:hypothetical protein
MIFELTEYRKLVDKINDLDKLISKIDFNDIPESENWSDYEGNLYAEYDHEQSRLIYSYLTQLRMDPEFRDEWKILSDSITKILSIEVEAGLHYNGTDDNGVDDIEFVSTTIRNNFYEVLNVQLFSSRNEVSEKYKSLLSNAQVNDIDESLVLKWEEAYTCLIDDFDKYAYDNNLSASLQAYFEQDFKDAVNIYVTKAKQTITARNEQKKLDSEARDAELLQLPKRIASKQAWESSGSQMPTGDPIVDSMIFRKYYNAALRLQSSYIKEREQQVEFQKVQKDYKDNGGFVYYSVGFWVFVTLSLGLWIYLISTGNDFLESTVTMAIIFFIGLSVAKNDNSGGKRYDKLLDEDKEARVSKMRSNPDITSIKVLVDNFRKEYEVWVRSGRIYNEYLVNIGKNVGFDDSDSMDLFSDSLDLESIGDGEFKLGVMIYCCSQILSEVEEWPYSSTYLLSYHKEIENLYIKRYSQWIKVNGLDTDSQSSLDSRLDSLAFRVEEAFFQKNRASVYDKSWLNDITLNRV